jgi:hypothetical protein
MTNDQKLATQFVKEYLELVKKYKLEVTGECFGISDINDSIFTIYFKDLKKDLMGQAKTFKPFDYKG